ncbi:MAG: cation:proton antiporter [Candidatus Micrarchaeota archaeon]
MAPLGLLVISLTLVYIFSEVCRHFNIPRVVGQIFVGILLGAFAKQLVFSSESLSTFSNLADVGIILLFFFTGFEVNLKEFQKHFRNSIGISILNTAIPFIAGTGLSLYLGYGLVEAIIIGICLSVSSTAVSIDFLEEFGMLKSRIGNIIVTAGAVDDFLELIFISIIVTFLQVSIGESPLQSLFIGMLAFIGTAVIIRFLLLPFVLGVIQKEHSSAGLFMIALVLTMAMATFSDYLGLGSLIGALIAGVIVRHSIIIERHRRPWEAHEISKTIHTVSFGFLVPIFFVWVGLNTDLGSIFAKPILSFAFAAIAIAGTVIGTALAVSWERGKWSDGILVGWGVTAKGDVELVVASLALKNGLISTEIFSALIFMAFSTTVIAPIVFRNLIKGKLALRA